MVDHLCIKIEHFENAIFDINNMALSNTTINVVLHAKLPWFVTLTVTQHVFNNARSTDIQKL